MSKSNQVLSILERRIRHGDYLGQDLPAERELALEIGVSRMTARKAVQRLVESGLLQRQPNGRVAVSKGKEEGALRVAFLVPTLTSMDVELWRMGLEHVAHKFNASMRTILYVHWDDPAILEALDAFDGVFLNPNSEPIPERIVERLREARRGVAILGRDMSAMGLPSVDLFPPAAVQQLLDHLAALGHRTIDCFNIQTVDSVIAARIEQWNLWRAANQMEGRLLGDPVRPYMDVPRAQAYQQMNKLLDEGWNGTALCCTTAPAAIGAMRALRDRKIEVGKDVSVGVINDEGMGRYLSPSLTSIEMPEPDSYLAVCLDWMRRQGSGWMGPLLLQANKLSLFVGESTGPCLK